MDKLGRVMSRIIKRVRSKLNASDMLAKGGIWVGTAKDGVIVYEWRDGAAVYSDVQFSTVSAAWSPLPSNIDRSTIMGDPVYFCLFLFISVYFLFI